MLTDRSSNKIYAIYNCNAFIPFSQYVYYSSYNSLTVIRIRYPYSRFTILEDL